MGDDDIDLLAEICDDPDDEDSDYGRGWQDGYRAGQAATPDGPRRWALPDEPGPEVTAVRGGSGTIYRRVGPHWQVGPRRGVESWWEILADGPLTDATPAADGQDGRDG
jgi:hypothetical protein